MNKNTWRQCQKHITEFFIPTYIGVHNTLPNCLLLTKSLSAHATVPHSGGIKRWCASDVCLDVWRLSVAYIGPKLRTERPRKTKIGIEVGHVTRDSDTIFKVKRSEVNLEGVGAYCGGLTHSLFIYILVLSRTTVTPSNILHWIAHFFEAKLTWPRPGRDQMLEAEAQANFSRPQPRPKFWPRVFNITGHFCLSVRPSRWGIVCLRISTEIAVYLRNGTR